MTDPAFAAVLYRMKSLSMVVNLIISSSDCYTSDYSGIVFMAQNTCMQTMGFSRDNGNNGPSWVICSDRVRFASFDTDKVLIDQITAQAYQHHCPLI